jgi:hypothetical protein
VLKRLVRKHERVEVWANVSHGGTRSYGGVE